MVACVRANLFCARTFTIYNVDRPLAWKEPNKSSLALKGQVEYEFTEVSFCESQAFPKGQSFTPEGLE
jgi:hypothetical protein